MRTCVLDWGRLTAKEELHKFLMEELNLPAWYGRNLDALYDCLTEQAEDIEFLYSNEEQTEKGLENYSKALKKVIQDAAKENPRIKVMI